MSARTGGEGPAERVPTQHQAPVTTAASAGEQFDSHVLLLTWSIEPCGAAVHSFSRNHTATGHNRSTNSSGESAGTITSTE